MTFTEKWRHRARKGSVSSPSYYSWNKMKERCYLKSHQAYDQYGGAGITVCDRWKNNFDNFVDDMGERPEGMSLDRIDSTKGYFKENCRWATHKQQQNNLKSNLKVMIYGVEMSVSEWARVYGINRQTICERIRRGWNPQKAVTTKVGAITRWSK